MQKTFQVKLGCDNCGHDDIYILPKRSVLVDWRPAESEFDKWSPSYYHPVGREDERTYLVCNECGLARLKVFWWREGGFMPASIPEEQNGSSDSRSSS